ncbi:hypothetical protein NEFER03_0326 [Nematocida sp. LUAm3]|nr:hypothetical protein NEFER03_0326 [Nematocida sp. LUAm3]KAI5173778.1 hypothetical protein NEFER02_0294 [Nematocida sp. LUAm2]KAI5177001.1 hypothetical protein NEFER01_0326 [Nematocida sp. LUAm1]
MGRREEWEYFNSNRRERRQEPQRRVYSTPEEYYNPYQPNRRHNWPQRRRVDMTRTRLSHIPQETRHRQDAAHESERPETISYTSPIEEEHILPSTSEHLDEHTPLSIEDKYEQTHVQASHLDKEHRSVQPEKMHVNKMDMASSVYAYILAKHKAEKEEKERVRKLNKEIKRRKKGTIEKELAFWKQKPLEKLGILPEELKDLLQQAETRSKKNEAKLKDLHPNKATLFLYDTKIFYPESLHKREVSVYTYLEEDAVIKKAFTELGKNFLEIQKNFLPWRSIKEIVNIYYQKKYPLRLKTWNNAYRDTRKITNADLKELVERGWTEEEQSIFSLLYPDVGKKWSFYVEKIKGKTEGDIRAYYKYYKKFIHKEEKPQRKTEEKKKEGIEKWKSHERQMFALLFPHIGKNWSILENYIITKTAAEIRSYHKTYYKNLSTGERILETHLKDIGEPSVQTEPFIHQKKTGHNQLHTYTAGVLFIPNASR